MYEQYVLDLLSDVFLGGACLSFCERLPLVLRNPRPLILEIQISHFGNPRSLILEIPDFSFWKIRTS